MRIHQYSTLQYTNQGQLTGIVEIVLHDVNHALSATLTHDDCINFFFEIGGLMRPGPGLTPLSVPDDQPVGFRMDQDLR